MSRRTMYKYEDLTDCQKKMLIAGNTDRYVAESLGCSIHTARKLKEAALTDIIARSRAGEKFSKCTADTSVYKHDVSINKPEEPIAKHIVIEVSSEEEEVKKVDLSKSEKAKAIERALQKRRLDEYMPNRKMIPSEAMRLVYDLDVPTEEVMQKTHLSKFAVDKFRTDYVQNHDEYYAFIGG